GPPEERPPPPAPPVPTRGSANTATRAHPASSAATADAAASSCANDIERSGKASAVRSDPSASSAGKSPCESLPQTGCERASARARVVRPSGDAERELALLVRRRDGGQCLA